ncbi:MAG: D-alanine--D-alanine ligase family protein [Gemmatimonadaceae bacterium]
MRITVLMGGTSVEREVSLASGLRIAEALRSKGHEVVAFDPAAGVIKPEDERRMRAAGVVHVAPPSLESLKSISRSSLLPNLGTQAEIRDADVLFLALHGGAGEDGRLQAMLDMTGATYTGSGHLGSALAMATDVSKTLFRAAGVPTADWIMAPAGVRQVEAVLGFPVVVKPSKQGSTVGLAVVRDAARLDEAVAEAFRYDDEVMIESFIGGREITVSVLGNIALPVGEIIPKHEIYDYECKYTKGMAEEVFPADLSAEETLEVQAHSLAAFRALKLSGYARIDFRLAADGVFYCLEANTLPGMTDLSLLPQAAMAVGIGFADLCEKIVHLTGRKGSVG